MAEIESMMMIDVHTHLYDDKFFPDGHSNFSELEQILEKSSQASVHKIILVSEEEETAKLILNLCKKYPKQLYAGIGLHPCSIHSEEQISRISELILENQEFICCIGEVGLDFTPGVLKGIKETNPQIENIDQVKNLQRKALEHFAELSKQTGLPLNVHSRSAGRPTIQLLAEKGATNVLMHCFDGSAKVVREGLQHGYYFSIPSNVIRSKQLQDLINVVPMDRILLETDSPALVPNLPKREDYESQDIFELAIKNARNDPSNIPLSAQMISQIKKCSLEEVISKTLLNTFKLFPKYFMFLEFKILPYLVLETRLKEMPTPSIGTTRHSTPQRHHVSRILNNKKRLLDESQGFGIKSKIPTAEIENRFSKLTHLLYDTNVKFKDLNEHVYPLIHEDVTFTDPWQTITGRSQFIAQLKGFHSAIFFTFDMLQLSVKVNENEEGGRVIVDGWMYLNQVKYLTGTIPLRTVLIYDFVFNGEGDTFQITDLEEMWSLGDIIEQLPIIGWFYNLFRFGAGFFFTIFFLICTFIALRLPFSNVTGNTPPNTTTSNPSKGKTSICSSLNPLNFAK